MQNSKAREKKAGKGHPRPQGFVYRESPADSNIITLSQENEMSEKEDKRTSITTLNG